jgi:uncharacterized protein (DUF1697 family)
VGARRREGAKAQSGTGEEGGTGRHVALLRGINLGGRQLPMKALVAMFEDAGCTQVRHYIASGNVVFSAPASLAARVPELVGRAIVKGFGFESPVVVRTAAEMLAVAKAHPFEGKGVDPKLLQVGFLVAAPPKARVAALDPRRSPPDVFEVRGREIFAYYPGGIARSKLTNAYFDAQLGIVSTFRNWRTVGVLAGMTGG